ncbi:MAG: RNA pseudouridine synthase [Bacteroidota bacterium]
MKIDVLLDHTDFLVVYKPAGLPVQSRLEDQLGLLGDLAQQGYDGLHLVHRIDQPVSGLLVLAKQPASAGRLQQLFQAGEIEKHYLAITNKIDIPLQGTLLHYLRRDGKKNKSYAFDKPLHHTQKAQLAYTVLQQLDRLQCLWIQLQTGRHHQIRSQLAAINIPIRGDVKYGYRRGNKNRSIHLHAWKVGFKWKGERVALRADLPADPIWNLFREIASSA